jgi:hypothetical protein
LNTRSIILNNNNDKTFYRAYSDYQEILDLFSFVYMLKNLTSFDKCFRLNLKKSPCMDSLFLYCVEKKYIQTIVAIVRLVILIMQEQI